MYVTESWEKQSRTFSVTKSDLRYNRQDKVFIVDNSRLKVGKNSLVNRMTCINGLVKLDLLNLSFNPYKVKCKNLILT